MIIVEAIDETKKRFPIQGVDKIVSLGDISIYTTGDDIPLSKVLESVKNKENGEPLSFDVKAATQEDLNNYFAEVLPEYDRERVYTTNIRKLLSWYNILVKNGITDFESEAKGE